jgi:hypothetical protein
MLNSLVGRVGTFELLVSGLLLHANRGAADACSGGARSTISE